MESNRKLQRHIDTLQNDKAALNKDVQDLTKEVGGVEKRLEGKIIITNVRCHDIKKYDFSCLPLLQYFDK